VPFSVHLDASGDVPEGHEDDDATHDDPSCMNVQIIKNLERSEELKS
jgi:hypothetical protein